MFGPYWGIPTPPLNGLKDPKLKFGSAESSSLISIRDDLSGFSATSGFLTLDVDSASFGAITIVGVSAVGIKATGEGNFSGKLRTVGADDAICALVIVGGGGAADGVAIGENNFGFSTIIGGGGGAPDAVTGVGKGEKDFLVSIGSADPATSFLKISRSRFLCLSHIVTAGRFFLATPLLSAPSMGLELNSV
jgi:hypothetical protein